ncbi:calpain-12 [Clupea harengus]|uniref:Calpain-12 n=1 Tax=Clupea harengus TaxID=7950 RepID=A0A6P8GFM8_CLUHA|nr:calpain-12 [Clupea harengus]
MASSKFQLGSIENPVKFKDQDYISLRDACLKSVSMFCDPSFPADQSSIGMPEDPNPDKEVTWLRPKEICENAVFVEGSTGTTDICQGQLGNCWLLAALSCLTMYPKLFVKVVPSKQSLTEAYAGIFHFCFWQYGEWVEVVVDDRLPVRSGRLLFSYSRSRNEFWSALVEKAYAKLMGHYSGLKGGNISEGMEDFTGGIAYSQPVSAYTPSVIWRQLSAALSRGTLLSCFIQAKTWSEIGTVTSEGLVRGHAYAITDTDKVQKDSTEVQLVRLRNPWGFVEYRGPWSDKSKDWETVDKAEIKRLELKKAEDGEFWIAVEAFSSLFDLMELCSLSPDSLNDSSSNGAPSWSLTSYDGSWVPGCSAGGSRRYRRSFWKNPQFQLALTAADVQGEDDDDGDDDEDDGDDDEDDEEKTDNAALSPSAQKQKEKGKKCTVLVELLQKDCRSKRTVKFLYMAFHIYKFQNSVGCLDQAFFTSHRPVGRSGKYQALRGVYGKVLLEPGIYVIVPSTYRPNIPGDFFLRIYAKTGNTLGHEEFTCSTDILTTVMSNPPLPADQMRVDNWFDQEDASDDRLDAAAFKRLVNSVLEKDYRLPLETCRQLVLGEDTGGRARLDRTQALKLVTSLRNLQSTFFLHDEDSSGTMSPFELAEALNASGMKCDSEVVKVLWERFGSGELHLPFHGFVSCVTRLRTLHDLYQSESPEVKTQGMTTWLPRLLAL